jgi:hypothetical protein
MHLQWIYWNFTLHDKLCGYLHKKKEEDIRITIKELAETSPDEVKQIPPRDKFQRAHQVPYQKSTVLDHCPPSSYYSKLANSSSRQPSKENSM